MGRASIQGNPLLPLTKLIFFPAGKIHDAALAILAAFEKWLSVKGNIRLCAGCSVSLFDGISLTDPNLR
jgi:hypothetical protein